MVGDPDCERDATAERTPAGATRHDHDHDQEHVRDHVPVREQVGPYALLERIGVGGMGVVHRGWDPRLERAVAIKLLRADAISGRNPDAARARLVREAQALARFSHPNVVQVFDVGTEDDTVWVAMELVEGTTLGRWRTDAPRSRTDILRAFASAGRGLAAAHAQGLVHRDFKPDNVFVGEDGRVCVGDFGLVRAAASTSARPGSRDAPAAAPLRDPSGTVDLGATALTGDGLVLGTPAYMAPEQHYGEPTDARTDQYAFCVALWEALYGARPFTGKSASELADAKRDRKLPRPDPGARVSATLHRAIVRGLHPAPDGRFPAMEPLLDTIDRATRPRGPRRLLLGLTAAAIGGALLIAGHGSVDTGCEAGEARILAVWNPSRSHAAATAFTATGVTYADDTWNRVLPALDGWAQAWAVTYGQVCQASRDGAQSQAELDVRMRCLDGALARFDGLLGAFEQADREVAVAAAMAVRALPAVGACASRPATEDELMPEDPQRARRVADLLAQLRRHNGAAQAGALTDAIVDAERLLVKARAIDWDPLTAEVEHAVGSAYEAAALYEQASEHMQAALHLAAAAGADVEAAEAATELVWLAGRHLADVEMAERWLPHAVAAVERMGERPLHVAKLVNAQGLVAGLSGRVDEACALYETSHRLYEQALGPEHPDTLTAITNLGAMEMQRGAYQRARDLHFRVLRILEGIYGPLHPEIAIALINLANARTRLGELHEATDDIERAIRIRRASLGESHPELATALNNLGAIQEARGLYADSERTHREALRLLQAALPAGHANIGASMTNVGSTLERQGRYDEAIELLERGRAILVDALPAEHPYLAYANVSLGAALRGAGRPEPAQDALDQARASCERGTIEPGVCALVDFERARLAWDLRPASRAESVELAERALRTLEVTPFAVATEHLDEMRAWVREHTSPG